MRILLALLAAASLAAPSAARQCALAPELPEPCELLAPGVPLPYPNAAAPSRLALPPATHLTLYVLGHSESRGYDDELQALLDADPILPGLSYTVLNRYIPGHEAWRWATPGQQGYQRIELMLQHAPRPFVVLGLFSNNMSFPIGAPDASDPNYVRFTSELASIAAHLHDGGLGATRVYLSAHRYKPANLLPSWYENCAIGAVMEQAALAGHAYLKPGPAQHDLHWCCFPDCYDPDQSHTNDAGDALMAATWHAFLRRELLGIGASCLGAPNSTGAAATLDFLGSTSLAEEDLRLGVTGLVPGGPGFFLYGAGAPLEPFGDGVLCTGAPRRRLGSILAADAGGAVELALDLAALPPSGALLPGSTWSFQYAYRDRLTPESAGFNASSATEVSFLP